MKKNNSDDSAEKNIKSSDVSIRKNKARLKNLGNILLMCIFLGLMAYCVYLIGFDTITDKDKLIEYIGRFGPLAPAVFFAVQFIQVIVAFIPGNVTGLAGGMLFGMFWGALISSVAIFAGSFVMFYAGRKYGRKIALRFVEEETIKKYEPRLAGKRAKTVLLMLYLIPFLPDDAICLVAGLTAMNYKSFTGIVIIGRIPSVIITNTIGAGFYSDNMTLIIILSVVYYIGVFLIYLYFDRIKNRVSHRKEKGDE